MKIQFIPHQNCLICAAVAFDHSVCLMGVKERQAAAECRFRPNQPHESACMLL